MRAEPGLKLFAYVGSSRAGSIRTLARFDTNTGYSLFGSVPITKLLNMELERCFFCDIQAQNVCSNCQLVAYCSPEHLKVHRPEKICFPFVVQTSPNVGRYMVATRDIKASGAGLD